MIARVVKIVCKPGLENELKQLGRNVLVPVNREAGCVHVYFLESSAENNNPFFGVVSIWESNETLNQMKASEPYRALIQELKPLIESLTDEVYETV